MKRLHRGWEMPRSNESWFALAETCTEGAIQTANNNNNKKKQNKQKKNKNKTIKTKTTPKKKQLMSMVCFLSCMLMRVFFVLAGLPFFSEGDLGLGWAFVTSSPL